MNSKTSKLTTLLSSASFLTLASSTNAIAQQMAQAQVAQAQMAQATELPEQVLITGSLIHGAAAVGVPVTNLGTQDFAQTGSLTTADLFRTVPSALVSPGPVGTNFGRNNAGPMALFFRLAKPFMRSPEQGADTLIWLASSADVDGVSGKYFSDRKEMEAKEVAYDPSVRRRLWEISEELTGLKVAA